MSEQRLHSSTGPQSASHRRPRTLRPRLSPSRGQACMYMVSRSLQFALKSYIIRENPPWWELILPFAALPIASWSGRADS